MRVFLCVSSTYANMKLDTGTDFYLQEFICFFINLDEKQVANKSKKNEKN